jgi:anthranilate phosphoribosyltransferase
VLGVRLDLPASTVARIGEEVGITFCFAAAFHPALRHAAVPRRELGVGTTFNFLGPLAHPAKPEAQAVGCADLAMAPLMAGVFARRGVDAWVFRGDDGLDELTTTTTSQVWAVRDGAVTEFTVDPARLGLGGGTVEGLRGRDASYNAEVVRRLVAGETGQVRDAVLLNAGAALAVHAREEGAPDDVLASGVARARDAVDSGRAQEVLERWVSACSAAS